MAKHNFYRGCKLLQDKVLQNYINGIYKEKDGTTVHLSSKVNKYNRTLIADLNDLNKTFYAIIVAEHIAIKLMKLNSNVNTGETRNIWNLIKAQSGTIHFNAALKHALKKYAVDKQEVYNSIRKDIKSQQERVLRNKKLLLDLLNDYGLGTLIEIVEKENNMDLIEHIIFYTDTVGINLTVGVDNKDKEKEDLINYYDTIENKYIEHLKEIAQKHNLNFDNVISEKLLQHRKLVESKINASKEREKQYKKDLHYNNAISYMSNDNVILQKDIVSGCYDEKKRLSLKKATDIHSRIVGFGGCIWYVACTKQKQVFYLTDYYTKTTDLLKTKFFGSLDSAKKWCDTIKDNVDITEVNSTYYKIFKLYSIGNLDSVVENKKNYIQTELSKSGLIVPQEINLVKNIITMCNGTDTTNSIATFVCYAVRSKTKNISDVQFISVQGDKITLVDRYYLMTPYTLEFSKNQNLLLFYQKTLGSDFIVDEYVLTIDSLWFKNKLKYMDEEYKALVEFLQGTSYYILRDKYKTVDFYKGQFNDVLHKREIELYKQQKYNKYVIMLSRGNSIEYYNEKQGYTTTYFNAATFDTLEEAKKQCKAFVENSKDTNSSILSRIYLI